jgi:DNA-binding NarL/FixJ family response regulator
MDLRQNRSSPTPLRRLVPRTRLTAREREVVQLVPQALSNREVARALVLSERTVESHVRIILARTGLTSRTELTRWYLRQPTR